MMIVLLCRRLELNHKNISLLHSNALLSVRCLSSDKSLHSNEDHSFTISYLINSFGFSLKAAKFASKKINFQNPDKPDCLRSFLRDEGFSDTQISGVVRKSPQLLMSNVRKTILPKIEFLQSVGVSRQVLPKIITRNPGMLNWSLKQSIIPLYNVLKRFLLCDDKVVKVLQRLGSNSMCYVKQDLAVNISILRGLGVPERNISLLLRTYPNILCQKVDKFNGAVNKIIGMGFDPAKYTFADALQTQLQISPKTLEDKIDVFRRWGLSEDQFWSAFRKHPRLGHFSAQTIMKKMNFLVNKMGVLPDVVVRYPIVLCYSLEKRIIPRCSVIRILLQKGLMKKEISLLSTIVISDKGFMNLYVNKHLEKEPQLLDVLQGKVDMRELGFEFNENCKASPA